ncbi:MAG: hypothetical protein J2P36_12245 [Ktedonobacteraceae bacterium]|nr:hypothetical protein [Ktedonobacteraceae bacterium]
MALKLDIKKAIGRLGLLRDPREDIVPATEDVISLLEQQPEMSSEELAELFHCTPKRARAVRTTASAIMRLSGKYPEEVLAKLEAGGKVKYTPPAPNDPPEQEDTPHPTTRRNRRTLQRMPLMPRLKVKKPF